MFHYYLWVHWYAWVWWSISLCLFIRSHEFIVCRAPLQIYVGVCIYSSVFHFKQSLSLSWHSPGRCILLLLLGRRAIFFEISISFYPSFSDCLCLCASKKGVVVHEFAKQTYTLMMKNEILVQRIDNKTSTCVSSNIAKRWFCANRSEVIKFMIYSYVLASYQLPSSRYSRVPYFYICCSFDFFLYIRASFLIQLHVIHFGSGWKMVMKFDAY